ncbi:DUF1428 family protein [Bacteriovorax stolpii]|uniref:DUF1428 domain-containing protein n=1 Tax=Bacteriovorax stolpii TaxID=960 RepID=A0A2K9NPB2_BACTC|nr:DUF1428 family protein [Bacteriovorax stolpii]AUN97360.1 DUF1428 domain-containing protein [Bacteriovorax stolpii]QDK42670.1 DUF1428 family protein [Bacteriovorax stolpii]TDP52531.1 uncharacterized protein YbaA (DUF1428 family) [Bacteriovorax stolpii]
MAKYIDVCMFPINKKYLANYKKTTTKIGKLLLKHGALSSSDFVADDKNATKDLFPQVIKVKTGEVIIIAMAEFKSKAHREKVFKSFQKDPATMKVMMDTKMDEKRMIMGGFKGIVSL